MSKTEPTVDELAERVRELENRAQPTLSQQDVQDYMDKLPVSRRQLLAAVAGGSISLPLLYADIAQASQGSDGDPYACVWLGDQNADGHELHNLGGYSFEGSDGGTVTGGRWGETDTDGLLEILNSGISGIDVGTVNAEQASIRDDNHIITVQPGESIQQAVNDLQTNYGRGGTVELTAGQHTESGIIMRSGTSLVGQGADTVLTKANDEPLLDCRNWKGKIEDLLVEGIDGGTTDIIRLRAENGGSCHNWHINNISHRGGSGTAAIHSPLYAVDGTSRNNVFYGKIENSYLWNTTGPNTTETGHNHGVLFESDGSVKTPWSQIRLENNWVRRYDTAGVEMKRQANVTIEKHISSANTVGIKTDTNLSHLAIRDSNIEGDVTGGKIGADDFILENSHIESCDQNGLDLSAAVEVIIRATKIAGNNTSSGGYNDLAVNNTTHQIEIGTGVAIGTIAYNNITIKPFNFSFAKHHTVSQTTVANGATETVGIIPTRDFTNEKPHVWSMGISDMTGDNTDLVIRLQNTTDAVTVASTGGLYAHGFPMGSGGNDSAVYEIQVTNNRAASADVTGLVDYSWGG